ncbi:MAG: carbonate dehydratase [Methylobacter sp.]|jgi:carbonic anhydrase|nr:carbonate dehydratase [Methylobacter sp.]
MNNTKLRRLFENNRVWATDILKREPEFFMELSAIQTPKYLWIGCSDSRVPANQITGLKPGEVFVHRNVGNLVVHTDLNCLSVLQYAIDVLKVEDVLVVGHYGCGGIKAALENTSLGLIDNWLRHIQDVRERHAFLFNSVTEFNAQWKLLCELNVIEQVRNIARTTIVEHAWKRSQDLTLHGCVYGLDNGMLQNLNISLDSNVKIDDMVRASVNDVYDRYVTKVGI